MAQQEDQTRYSEFEDRIKELKAENQQLKEQLKKHISKMKETERDKEKSEAKIEMLKKELEEVKSLNLELKTTEKKSVKCNMQLVWKRQEAEKENEQSKVKIEKLKKDLEEKDIMIQKITSELKYLKQNGREEDHVKYHKLLNRVQDLISNWDEFEFEELVNKLTELSQLYQIHLRHMKYMISGHFAKWTESAIGLIRREVLSYIHYSNDPGINDLILDLDSKHYFDNNCYGGGVKCRGGCSNMNCGAAAKQELYTWKEQRNMIIHRNEERCWFSPVEMIQLMRNVEKVITNCAKRTKLMSKDDNNNNNNNQNDSNKDDCKFQ